MWTNFIHIELLCLPLINLFVLDPLLRRHVIAFELDVEDEQTKHEQVERQHDQPLHDPLDEEEPAGARPAEVAAEPPAAVAEQDAAHEEHEAGQEAQEAALVAPADAVVELGAVVVEDLHARVALGAVRGPRQFAQAAGLADLQRVLVLHVQLGRDPQVQLRLLLSVQDYARVRAWHYQH